MADKITQSVILGVGIKYLAVVDIEEGTTKDKTTYIKVPNPRSGITENQIKTAMQNYLTGNIFLDPRAAEPLENASIDTAYTEITKTTDYDIGFFDD